MLSELEIRAIAQNIVNKAKATSKYEQGTLRRSISYTYIKGVLTFKQMFYGVFNENSQLEKLAALLVPNGTPYNIILIEIDGGIKEVGRTKGGRATQRSAIASAVNSGSKNIKKLIGLIVAKRKRDGEKENENTN